ncbi:MAG: class I SAM-dependent methyltransferase [Alphaproteobacteria bacterium]|nr:class I SAM-dependent methyltransferase [Alphaproteobacteria bacterium]
MGVYADYVVPRLIAFSMRSKEATRIRRTVVPAARGRVLEIGIGSGLNLPFYGEDVSAVIGLDPSRQLLAMTERSGRGDAAPFAVDLTYGSAEDMPFEDRSFDTVLTTWTLCSIAEAGRALAEIRRVLRPDGALIFVEHGRSPDLGVRRWQERINPIWTTLSGGCNLNRDIAALIRDAGFAIDRLEVGYLVKGPKIATYHYEGRARPA